MNKETNNKQQTTNNAVRIGAFSLFGLLTSDYELRTNGGQAMLAAVLFFIMLGTTAIVAVGTPVLREGAHIKDVHESRQSLLAAESLADDIAFRVKRGIAVAPSETLMVGSSTATAVITDVAGGKDVNVVGDTNTTIRKVATRLIVGVGTAFNYGIQVGNGGFTLGNNAGVNGNIYANGNVVGSNGAFITGSAVAANSTALTVDQSNASPTTPPNSITFGNTNDTEDVAQSFRVSTTSQANKIQFYIKKVSTPSNATVRLVADNGGVPGNSTLASGTLSAAQVTTAFGWVDVVFSSNPELTPGITYWVVIDAASNASKYYILAANILYVDGGAKIGRHGSSWNATNPVNLDGYFNLFLGGVTATIDTVIVGQAGVGDAWAHTVQNSTVAGILYCQNGSGNNKSCTTSSPDPSPTAFPISDANIDEWKSDAAVGGSIEGDYTPGGASSTLGPRIINGSLTITNSHVLTVTGTLHITGNFSVSNNARVQLSQGYGASSGVIVVDGQISISNGAFFSGSGMSGSYVMLLTTNTGGTAISVGNNAGTVILNAQQGTISFSNNSGAKEATAKQISLGNNTAITYESGLADVSFSSGPSGGFTVTNWRETE